MTARPRPRPRGRPRISEGEASVSLTLRLPESLMARIRAVAEREDRSASYIIRRGAERECGRAEG